MLLHLPLVLPRVLLESDQIFVFRYIRFRFFYVYEVINYFDQSFLCYSASTISQILTVLNLFDLFSSFVFAISVVFQSCQEIKKLKI